MLKYGDTISYFTATSFDSGTSVSVHEHKLQRPQSKRASLIPQTLKEMEEDPEFVRLSNEYQLKSQKEMTKEEKLRRKRALDNLGKLKSTSFVVVINATIMSNQ